MCENGDYIHVSVPNIYGTSSSTYLIIFLKVISKVLFFNITRRFTNLLVQLSIFLIDLFVGTYRLSSHARLEAFVIQTKLQLNVCVLQLVVVEQPLLKNYTQGVTTPQAWIKETETELSGSRVLTLPGKFEPATPKSLA